MPRKLVAVTNREEMFLVRDQLVEKYTKTGKEMRFGDDFVACDEDFVQIQSVKVDVDMSSFVGYDEVDYSRVLDKITNYIASLEKLYGKVEKLSKENSSDTPETSKIDDIEEEKVEEDSDTKNDENNDTSNDDEDLDSDIEEGEQDEV